MLTYSIVFLSLLYLTINNNFPCGSNCANCSSSTQCTTCSLQYYPQITTSILQCLPCPSFCLQCISSSLCTKCLDPYILSNNTCEPCQITNSLKCININSASQCITGYYPSDNFCYNCLLNCAQCNSNSDCQSCVPGFYLNASVLTCNFCPTNCLTCNQYNSSVCLSCANGYKLSAANTCDQVTCSISNCLYCSSATVCWQCQLGYYWNNTQGACLLGASILCNYGAEGPFPNQCNNQCPYFAYNAQQNGTAMWCLPYNNFNVNGSISSYLYYYSYNNIDSLQQFLSTSNSLFQQQSGQYSYPISAGDQLTLPVLPSYYKITISLKYRSVSPISITISAETQQTIQIQNTTIPSFNITPTIYTFSTIYVHSNNIKLTFNNTLNLVQLLIQIINCPNNCYRCLNPNLCQMCNTPQYVSFYQCVNNCTIYYHLVSNRTCLTSCPNTYYPINLGTNQKFCQPCTSPCLNCINQIQCVSCISGKYLFGYFCNSSCPDSYYASLSTGQCIPCISPCKTCSNQTACLSCSQGFWDSAQSICTSQCSSGSFGNPNTNTCQLCQNPCNTCRNSSLNCITCVTDYFFYNYQCLPSCPDKFYPNMTNMSCILCQPPCLTCSSLNVCLSCSDNYLYNSQCLLNCPDSYYSNIDNKSCLACSSQCKTCQIFGQCTSCNNGTCYLQGSCLVGCPSSQYYLNMLYENTVNETCQCQLCQSPCKQCTSASICTSCLQGFLQQSSNSCVTVCPLGFYANASTFECTMCQLQYTSLCIQCNSTSCTRCMSTYLLYNNSCQLSCPSQYFKSSQQCSKCVPPCYQCISFYSCLSCISPYLFNNGSCIIQCPFGKVTYYNSTSNMSICILCQLPCITCQNSSPTNCTMCQYGTYLYQNNNTCVDQCSSITPIYTLYDQLVSSSCSACLLPCKTCTSQSMCLSCQIGYLTVTGKCQNCPYSTYADSSGICQSCPTACTNCYSSLYCISCNEGFYLYGYECISNISVCLDNGYYPVGRVCQPCQMPCLLCNTTSSNCISCVTGFIFYSNSCLTQCPKGLYRNFSTCSSCDTFCESCIGSSTYCLSCKPSYFMMMSKMSCVSSCPNATFTSGSTCQMCQYPCKQCITQLQCTSCLSGTLINTTCLSSCPSSYYSDDNLICQMCQSPCSQCQDLPTLCKLCITGYYLFNSTCLSSCPALYFGQTESHQCLQCLGLCKQCSSDINCTSCDSNLMYFFNPTNNYGQCVSQCPISYFNSTGIYQATLRAQCKPCLPQCLTCVNNIQCILCANNAVQYNGSCYPQCSAQMYSASGICQPCSPPCFNCTDAYTCTACMNDSFLLVGSAQCIVGNICPLGYYLIPGTKECSSQCPLGYYYRNDRTCNNSGCSVDEYKGANMHCFNQCPDGYISNSNYSCIPCSGQVCNNGLFYTVTSQIIGDQLLLYLIFTQTPQYLVSQPVIKLSPYFDSQLITTTSRRMLHTNKQQSQRILQTQNSVPAIRNITIQLFPLQSFSQQALTLTFQNALATFGNPLQRPSKTIMLQGYDFYPQLPSIQLGPLLLICSLVGLISNPYMVDFSQFVYVLALVDLHYPFNLASALESGALAHLHNLWKIQQKYAIGLAKFSYVTDMGLVSNSAINILIVGIGLIIFLIILVIHQLLKKLTIYKKLQQNPIQNIQNDDSIQNKNKLQQLKIKQQSLLSIIKYKFLQNNFLSNYQHQFLNRLIYFNYLPLTIFTISQFKCLNYSQYSNNDLIASVLVFFVLILIIIYPIYCSYAQKPKYTFLMLRKLILSLALVLSVQNPSYIIGVATVTFIMTAILVGTYSIQKWKQKTKFNTIMEIFQACLMIFFAIFCIIGEGNHTIVKLYLSWIIITFIIVIAIAYLLFSILLMILWGCKKYKGIDYIQIWNQKDQKDTLTVHTDSQMGQKSNKIQEKQTNDENQQKGITIDQLLSTFQKPSIKPEQNPINLPQQKNSQQNQKKQQQQNPKNNNNNRFWTYNDNQDQQSNKNEQKPPQRLIRCINQFSDFDPKQNKHESQNTN